MSEEKRDRLAVSEDELIKRTALNDREAFECLYSRMHRSVYAYALTILKNKEDAEEVMQDCFLKIRAAAHTYHAQGKARAWIFTIARNLCRMKCRETQKSVRVPVEDLESLLVFDPQTDISLRLALETAFKVLSDQDRQIIVLRAYSDLKFTEIAAITELPLPTVLSKYRRGLAKLRKELEGKL